MMCVSLYVIVHSKINTCLINAHINFTYDTSTQPIKSAMMKKYPTPSA